jgi:hypothetical protein
MNNVRLVCGSQAVDLPTDFGILINKAIADIREPEQRSSDWSKTFTLPGTKANNKLFSHLFQLDLSIRNTSSTQFNPDFNPNLKAPAVLYVDEVSQIEGFIRLLNIKVTDRGQVEYECSMHGQLADMFAIIADAKLSDLDFTEYNHTITNTNIFNSWDTQVIKNGSGYVNFASGSPIGEGYVYGWVDNGNYANYNNLYTDDMTVYLYAKNVVDKIFSGAGYGYSSGSFFNSAQFKRLVVPCSTRMPILTESQVANRSFEGQSSGTPTYTAGQKINFATEISDPSSQYDNATSIFTNGFSGQRYDFYFVSDFTITSLTANTDYAIEYDLVIDGSLYFTSTHYFATGVSTTYSDVLDVIWQGFRLNGGQTVQVQLKGIYEFVPALNRYVGPITTATYTQNANSAFANRVDNSRAGYNDTIDFTGFFSDESKQRDFLKWLFVMFNLYAEPDPDNLKTLVVKPREEFYNSTVRDWSQKRDISQPLEIIPMGELDGNRYTFTYSEGDDEGNKEYKQDFDRIYGDRRITVTNDFQKDEKKIEVGFAPTLVYTYADKTFPFIGTTNDDEKTNTGKLRIMQFKAKTCASYTVYYGTTGSTSSTTKTTYPYMGHLDDPLASSTDINFGMPRRVNLPISTPYTNNNLYNGYWSKYMAEITDKDSKIVRGAFHLSPADMEKLSFQDLYYFDRNYFRLNKIEDYDPVNPSVNICEFLFLKTGQTFTASTGNTGGGGQQGGGVDTEYDPTGGGGNGKVIKDKGFSNGRNNAIGDGLAVGDNISNFGRSNTALGGSGVVFAPGCERAVVIGGGVQFVNSDEVWIRGKEVTASNFSTNGVTVVSSASPYTALAMDEIIVITTAGAYTVNLPAAADVPNKIYTIKKGSNDGGGVTVSASDNIDGSATYTIATYNDVIRLVSDGSTYYIISK